MSGCCFALFLTVNRQCVELCRVVSCNLSAVLFLFGLKVQGTDDGDGGDVVTYSTVKVSSAGSSDDPSNLYATVNKPKK